MSLIKKMRKQKAIYWEKESTANEFGSYTFKAPVEIDCRWEDSDGQIRNQEGEVFDSKAVVYVDRKMKVGDKLKFGEMDTNTSVDPLEDSLAYDIVGFKKTPNLKAKEFLLEAYL